MFFVIKNNIDKNGSYVSCEMVAHSTDAEKILENAVMSFVAFEGGQKMLENVKIIDVHSLNQVAEPLIDTILLYRVIAEPNQVHVYQRISRQVPGYVFGQSIVPEFTRIKIFELVKYGGEIADELPVPPVTITDVSIENEPQMSIPTIIIETMSVDMHLASIADLSTQIMQVEMHPAIIIEQVESVCKNQEELGSILMDLLTSLESSPKFLSMKEKNN